MAVDETNAEKPMQAGLTSQAGRTWGCWAEFQEPTAKWNKISPPRVGRGADCPQNQIQVMLP
jgi:hypothetical protein